MNNKLILVGIAIGLIGCVRIEAPDNLVSDTVQAGKDVYDSVKERRANRSKDQQVFTHKYPVPNGEPISESSSNCINVAIETAKKTLHSEQLKVETSSTKPIQENGKTVLECSIVVTSAK